MTLESTRRPLSQAAILIATLLASVSPAKRSVDTALPIRTFHSSTKYTTRKLRMDDGVDACFLGNHITLAF